MKCPLCGEETIVIDSIYKAKKNSTDQYFRRRRKCLKCENRFTTHEFCAKHLPIVEPSAQAIVDCLEADSGQLFRLKVMLSRSKSNNNKFEPTPEQKERMNSFLSLIQERMRAQANE